MLKNLRKIFTKVKDKNNINDNKINREENRETSILNDKVEVLSKSEKDESTIRSIDEVGKHNANIVRTRLNAYVIKNKEEDFRLMDYNMDTGEVVWIEGKLFNNLRGLKRVRWSPSSGSATVYYGYISEEEKGEKLVSSVYIMNILHNMINTNSLDNVVYNIKNGTITVNSITGDSKVFHIFGVSSVVEMEMLLNKIGLALNRE